MHCQIEASDLFINDQGIEDFDDDQKEWGYPKHTGRFLAFRAFRMAFTLFCKI